MKYDELSSDTNRKIVAKRIDFEKKVEEASTIYNRAKKDKDFAEYNLKKLQRECTHANAVIKHGWQGGGIYYCHCSCPECGRRGGRYIPQYHMHMNNSWYTNTEYHITLEEAIVIGEKMGESLFDSGYWWGKVDDYDKLTKDTSEGWV